MDDSTGAAPVRQEAEAAWRAQEYDRAGELFHESASLSPEDADAAFFALASDALADGAAYSSIASLPEPARRVFGDAAGRFGSDKAFFAACTRVVTAMIEVTSRHYEAVTAYWKKEQKKHRRDPEAKAHADALLTDCVNTVSEAAKQTVSAALEQAQDLSAADEFFWTALLTLLDNAQTCRLSAEVGQDGEIAALFDEIDRLRGNVFGDFTGEVDLPEDEGEYVETVCPHCGETLSFAPSELSGEKTAECPFCGGRISG